MQIVTDTSQEGWGSQVSGDLDSESTRQAQGFWEANMTHISSNLRELTAVLLSLMAFLPIIRNKSVQILTDNICTAAYVNFQGGPCQQLNEVARKLWTLVPTNNIEISAQYLKGTLNVQADTLSRLNSQYEWVLHPRFFQFLDKVWGPHTIDRFASMNTTQLEKYNTRFADPFAPEDALHQADWDLENNFVNTPLKLLDRVIKMIVTQQAWATIIAPMWNAKIWCQKL